MINHDRIEEWSKNHFFVYLYLCAVKADHKVTESEMEEFLDQYETLKVLDKDYMGIIKDALIEYKDHEIEERLEFIKTYVPKIFGDSEQSKKLMDGLFEISYSDGSVNPLESDLIRLIQGLVA